MFCCVKHAITFHFGGVRAYNEQNLGTRKTVEKFKIFIGFKNMVCCNLCVSSDGYVGNLKAMETNGIFMSASELFRKYDMDSHLRKMQMYQNYNVSESQFAQFIGKCRLYQYLPNADKRMIPELMMTDTQIGLVAQAYYRDADFGRGDSRNVSMWQVFNMLTGSNKSSYIDNFLDRACNATAITEGLCKALCGDSEYGWFLS